MESREKRIQTALNLAAKQFQSPPPRWAESRLKAVEELNDYFHLIQYLEHANTWEEWLPPESSRINGS